MTQSDQVTEKAFRSPIQCVRDEAGFCRRGEITRHQFLLSLVNRMVQEMHDSGWSDDCIIYYLKGGKMDNPKKATVAEAWNKLPSFAIARSSQWQEVLRLAGLKPAVRKNSPREISIVWDQLGTYFRDKAIILETDRQKVLRALARERELARLTAVGATQSPSLRGAATLSDILRGQPQKIVQDIPQFQTTPARSLDSWMGERKKRRTPHPEQPYFDDPDRVRDRWEDLPPVGTRADMARTGNFCKRA